MPTNPNDRRATVAVWCAENGLTANRIACTDAQFIAEEPDSERVRFTAREFITDDDGMKVLCRCDWECAPTHYKARRIDMDDLPRPDFWPQGSCYLDLDTFITNG
ncbi:hypothetical protein [Flexivirga sp.]|uniref:hypothetical protein n=1 Tax=Flexivirga sp. TaxID=1962927 RepID=UPI003F7DAFD5